MKKWIPIVFLMTGCQTLQDNPYLSPFLPTLQFDRLQVNYIDFQEIDTEFVFTVDNPNPIGIDIEAFSYGLQFSDIEWLSGDNPDGLLLHAMNTSEVSLPAELVFAELYDMVKTSRGQDSLPFQLDGDFGLSLDNMFTPEEQQSSSPEDLLILPYDVSGSFPALRRPHFSLQRLQLQELSFSNIKLDLLIDVDNEHASNLIFQRFSYDLQLSGNSIISGIVDDLGEIIHGAQHSADTANRSLRIPIEIDTFESVSQIWDVLSGGNRLDIGFSAISDVDTPFGLVELHIDETGDIAIDLQ